MRRRRGSSSPAISLFSFQDIITSVIGIMVLLLMVLAIELVSRKQGEAAQSDAASATPLDLAELEQQIHDLQQRIRDVQAATVVEDFESLAQLSPSNVSEQRRELAATIERLRQQQLANTLVTQSAQQKLRETQSSTRNNTEVQTELKRLQSELRESEASRARLISGNRLIFNPAPGGKTAWLVELTGQQIAVAPVASPNNIKVFAESRTSTRIDTWWAWAKARDRQSEYFVLILKPSAIESYKTIRTRIREAGFDLGLELIAEDQTVLQPDDGAGD